jgi:hypothetical protein
MRPFRSTISLLHVHPGLDVQTVQIPPQSAVSHGQCEDSGMLPNITPDFPAVFELTTD